MIKIIKTKFFLVTLILVFFSIYALLINANKGVFVDQKINIKNSVEQNVPTTFTNVKYKFSDDKNNNYTLIGEKASLENNDYELIKLSKVKATTILSDGTLLKITSNNANFFKNEKNIFFYNNILISNKNKTIRSNNADFLFKVNKIEIFNNVIYKDDKNLIKCDKLIFNILTKNIDIKMNSKEKQIYGKKK